MVTLTQRDYVTAKSTHTLQRGWPDAVGLPHLQTNSLLIH